MQRAFRRGIDRRTLLRLAALGLVGVPAARALPAAADEPGISVLVPSDVGDDEHWVAVNLTQQLALGMVGGEVVHVAPVTTGKDGWETPEGEWRILWRVYNETMTSAAIGVPPNSPDGYWLDDVLFTQYFTYAGHALHLNYWRPDWVFGNRRTSHGCVGMRYNDAAFFWRHVNVGYRVVIFS